MVAQGDGKFVPRGWPQNPSKPKKVKSEDWKTAQKVVQHKYSGISKSLTISFLSYFKKRTDPVHNPRIF